MKKLLMSLAVLVAATGIAGAASIVWSSNAGEVLAKDGNNFSTGAAFLVYCGANGSIDLAWDTVSGAWNMGDDVVVDSAPLLGAATTSYSASWGSYTGSTVVETSVGAKYAVVVASEGVYPGTTLPGADQGYYGISGTYTQTKDGLTDSEDFKAGVITVDQPLPGPGPVPPPPVPEPTTYALIGVAAAALALRKRFMKK